MINPKELRIGNWVIFDRRHEQILGDISGPHGLHQESNSNLSPISLTPEILEKCGFVRSQNRPMQDHYEIKDGGKKFILYIPWRIDGLVKLYFAPKWGGIKTPVVYLHQLQNLYFALTGAELNYSPDNKINT